MSLSRADSLRALHSLSRRLRDDFDAWILREGDRAPHSARALARVAIGIAERMTADIDALDNTLLAGGGVDTDSIVGLANRARFVEQVHGLLEHSTYQSLHPVLSPTVRYELDELGIAGSVLATGTRDASYEVITLTRKRFDGLPTIAVSMVSNGRYASFVFPTLHSTGRSITSSSTTSLDMRRTALLPCRTRRSSIRRWARTCWSEYKSRRS